MAQPVSVRCVSCRWFLHDPTGSSISIDGIRSVGECRIRSTPSSFPFRHGGHWCGEHVAVPAIAPVDLDVLEQP